MADQLLLRVGEIIGRNSAHGIRTCSLCMAGQLHCLSCCWSPNMYDYECIPLLLNYNLSDTLTLFDCHQRTTPICSTRIKTIHVFGKVANQFPLRWFVNRPSLVETCYYWGYDS